MKILKKNILFSFILLVLINFPKINLVSIAGLQQGLRVDDILFLVFLFGCIIKRSKVRILGGYSGVALIIFMFISCFLSFIFIEEFNFISVVFNFRWLQYFLFAYVFKDVFENSSINVFKLSLWLQLLISLIQLYILMDYRSQGSFNGPWELANVAFLLGLYIYFKEDKKKYLIITFLIIVLSASRMTLIAMVIIGLIFFYDFMKNKKSKIKLIIITATLLSFIFLSPLLIKYFSLDFLYNVEVIYDLLGTIKNEVLLSVRSGNNSSSLFGEFKDSLDGSLTMRFDMWLNLFFTFMSYQPRIIAILFGISPGQIGIIIDGLYVRLFFEFGLIGSFLFYRWIKSLMRIYANSGFYLIVLLIAGLTLDPFTSSKVMLALTAVMLMNNKKIIE
tara:strand:- start:8 stop:1177 length:1170 start_codon:yes stop_codon:yes gene_type:complete